MLWTVLYSPFVLRDVLPSEHYSGVHFPQHVRFFVEHILEAEVDKADELLFTFCTGFQQLYGREACTPNLHMHCHLKECILDVGPLYSFWCFSFERYNGILEKMQKSWHAPEIQLIHKFSNLQILAAIELPEDSPEEMVQCIKKIKENKAALPDPVTDNLSFIRYEQYTICRPDELCALLLSCHHPGREKFMMECEKQALVEMYHTIYCPQNVEHVPLRYTQFLQIQTFEQIYTCTRSRTTRSSAIVAIWPHLSGILPASLSCIDNITAGVVQYFMIHSPAIKIPMLLKTIQLWRVGIIF